ncbi:16S rRNA (uracil(1498)-N(3))-methyltransferase [Nocardioides limicola]|uniref:16S rRNA (uracil(1498)-N(3))-methyltransferase n=1 Tax=Nocardioides limicola TaxID=2803368 RepID=UPI00193C7916|nr:16S rRNA (uracil(1498)-N(3))-methyltransferase [Nocardioides sp. DJM-14]
MSLPVHLVPNLAQTSVGGTVEVEGDEAHHAVVVRRLEVGERVVLTDGRGRSVTGPITSTGKRRFTVEVADLTDSPAPAPDVTVVQALPKGDRGERAVEMLTEVGVARIVPWAAERSVAVWRGERATKGHAKWTATAREAAKQARRAWFPVVDGLTDTTEVVELLASADLAVVLHEDGAIPMASLTVPESGSIVVVVGPEGGLAPAELAAFAEVGVESVHLGAEVLRTSTAGVAAVAAVLSRTRRWA